MPTQVPSSVLTLRERCTSAGLKLVHNDARGALVRVISSAKGGGVYLCAGPTTVDAAGWILDAIDMSGRVVVQQEDATELPTLRECFNTDLRVSVHAQPLVSFIGDVEAHRFEFVVLDCAYAASGTLDVLVSALSDGGCLLVTDDTEEKNPPALTPVADVVGAYLFGIGTLFTKRRAGSRPRRRGGRRTRDDER